MARQTTEVVLSSIVTSGVSNGPLWVVLDTPFPSGSGMAARVEKSAVRHVNVYLYRSHQAQHLVLRLISVGDGDCGSMRGDWPCHRVSCARLNEMSLRVFQSTKKTYHVVHPSGQPMMKAFRSLHC